MLAFAKHLGADIKHISGNGKSDAEGNFGTVSEFTETQENEIAIGT